MTIVIDASVTVAALTDSGSVGAWADELLSSEDLIAPHLLPVEVANILRRIEHSGTVPRDAITMAHDVLNRLHINFYPYEPFADRVWQLRNNITSYDAWYVAISEALDAPLATLDRRLAQAPGTSCRFIAPT